MQISVHVYPNRFPLPFYWREKKLTRYKIDAGEALRISIKNDGYKAIKGKLDRASDSDVAIIWSWKQKNLISEMKRKGKHILVLERGFIQPRNEWYSLALDGFNNRGRFIDAQDNGERWNEFFSGYLKPWRYNEDSYALLIGQVPNDASLHGVDIVEWAQDQTDRLCKIGVDVVYRPHPECETPCPIGATLSSSSLQNDLKNAGRVVTFCSTTAVEAVLAGIPVVVEDMGSVAWPMSSHRVEDDLIRPDREKWCHDLSWRQWRFEELADGTAWNYIKTLL